MKTTCIVVMSMHALYIVYIIIDRPFFHRFNNRFEIFGSLFTISSYGGALWSAVIDNVDDARPIDAWTLVVTLGGGVYVSIELFLAIKTGAFKAKTFPELYELCENGRPKKLIHYTDKQKAQKVHEAKQKAQRGEQKDFDVAQKEWQQQDQRAQAQAQALLQAKEQAQAILQAKEQAEVQHDTEAPADKELNDQESRTDEETKDEQAQKQGETESEEAQPAERIPEGVTPQVRVTTGHGNSSRFAATWLLRTVIVA